MIDYVWWPVLVLLTTLILQGEMAAGRLPKEWKLVPVVMVVTAWGSLILSIAGLLIWKYWL